MLDIDIAYLYIERLCHNRNMIQKDNSIIIKYFHSNIFEFIDYYLIDKCSGNIVCYGSKSRIIKSDESRC